MEMKEDMRVVGVNKILGIGSDVGGRFAVATPKWSN